MPRPYAEDWMDGRSVPPLVIDGDHTLNGNHKGTVHVEAGRFVLAGEIHGTLDIQRGVEARITGEQHGTVHVQSGATVIVTGALHGTTTVEAGATLVVEPGGRLAGTLQNDGSVVVRGVFGGKETGSREVTLEAGGYIKQPIVRDGTRIYEW